MARRDGRIRASASGFMLQYAYVLQYGALFGALSAVPHRHRHGHVTVNEDGDAGTV